MGAQQGALLSGMLPATVISLECVAVVWLPSELQAIPRPSQIARLAGWLTLAGVQVQSEMNPVTRKWPSIRWGERRESFSLADR